MTRYYDAKLVDTGTPFGLSFTRGSECDVRMDGLLSDIVIWNDKGIRYITPQQVKDHLILGPEKDNETPAEEDTELEELRAEILHSRIGLLSTPYPVQAKPRKGFPDSWNGVPVIVADNSPFVHPDRNDRYWWADWWFDDDGGLAVYVQTQVAYGILDQPPEERQFQLQDTFTHELEEAQGSWAWTFKEYPQAAYSQRGGLAQQAGGIVHATMRDVVAQGSEAKYNRWFDRELRTVLKKGA